MSTIGNDPLHLLTATEKGKVINTSFELQTNSNIFTDRN